MITLQWLYVLAGAMFAAFALLSALDRVNRKRLGNAIFWGLMALSLLAGDAIGDFGNGLLVLGLAGLAGSSPHEVKFTPAAAAKGGRVRLRFSARFPSSARLALEAAIVQRPRIRGFVIEDMKVERGDREVLATGTVATPAEEPAQS